MKRASCLSRCAAIVLLVLAGNWNALAPAAEPSCAATPAADNEVVVWRYLISGRPEAILRDPQQKPRRGEAIFGDFLLHVPTGACVYRYWMADDGAAPDALEAESRKYRLLAGYDGNRAWIVSYVEPDGIARSAHSKPVQASAPAVGLAAKSPAADWPIAWRQYAPLHNLTTLAEVAGWSNADFTGAVAQAKKLVVLEPADLAKFHLEAWKRDAEQAYLVLPATGAGPFLCWRYVLAVDDQPAALATCAIRITAPGVTGPEETGHSGAWGFVYPRRFQITRQDSVTAKFDKLFCLASYGIGGEVVELDAAAKDKSK